VSDLPYIIQRHLIVGRSKLGFEEGRRGKKREEEGRRGKKREEEGRRGKKREEEGRRIEGINMRRNRFGVEK
jgi:hypothetical protein